MARVVRMRVLGAVELVAKLVPMMAAVEVRVLRRRADRRGVPERDVSERRRRRGLDDDRRILGVVPRLFALRLDRPRHLAVVVVRRHVDAEAVQNLARKVVVGRMLAEMMRVGVRAEVGADD